MAILNAGIVAPTGGYQISRSLRFNSADSAYLNRTPASAGNRTTWTWSGWVKRGGITLSSNTPFFSAGTSSSEFSMFYVSSTTDRLTFYTLSGGVDYGFQTSAVLRDPSAWYHLMCVYDSTNGTASNRLKLYINGVQYTDKATDYGDIPLNHQTFINATNEHLTGKYTGNTQYLNGYLTEINFIDGQALTPSSFGETDTDTGVWKPKKYTGSYSGNSFYLNFSDNSGTTSTTLGKDSSGLGNNWTPNNFSVTAGAGNDSLVDVPTLWGSDTGLGAECRGNYATWNPLNNPSASTFSNGNLDASNSSGVKAISTIGVSSGKWYWEVLLNALGSQDVEVGVAQAGATNINNTAGAYGWGVKLSRRWDNGTLTSSSIGTATTSDIVGIALDSTNFTFTVYKNGSQLYQTTGIVSGTFFPVVFSGGAAGSDNVTVNFGQRPFAYTAPSGFKALCTQNLPEPVIKDGGDYFNTVLWTGNGSTSRGITGVGFQPDFVWLKARSLGAQNHTLVDAVRGYGTSAMDTLSSNLTTQEVSDASNASFTPYYGNMQSLNADGFTVAGGSTGIVDVVNKNNETYVAWNWKANGAGSSNTAGTITSTVSVNTTSGFSIVTYTGNGTGGATVGHGLGVAPSMIIIKNRTDSASAFWCVYHRSAFVSGADPNVLYLNTTDTQADDTNVWGASPEFSSTIFKLGDYNGSNGSGDSFVAYCFAPVAGYSAFGSYTGNGLDNGPYIFTNFRPAFVMIKRATSGISSGWLMYDDKRSTYNVVGNVLEANESAAEGVDVSTRYIDFLSNGFKLRTFASALNHSDGGTYIYMAFAENPFKYSLAR